MNLFAAIALLCQVSGADLATVSEDQARCQHFFVQCMGETLRQDESIQKERLKKCVLARKN